MFHQGGDFGGEIFEQGGAVDDAGAGTGVDAGELIEGGPETGNEGGGDAAFFGSGLVLGNGADGDEIGGGVDEELVVEFLIVAEFEIDLGAAVESFPTAFPAVRFLPESPDGPAGRVDRRSTLGVSNCSTRKRTERELRAFTGLVARNPITPVQVGT